MGFSELWIQFNIVIGLFLLQYEGRIIYSKLSLVIFSRTHRRLNFLKCWKKTFPLIELAGNISAMEDMFVD